MSETTYMEEIGAECEEFQKNLDHILSQGMTHHDLYSENIVWLKLRINIYLKLKLTVFK